MCVFSLNLMKRHVDAQTVHTNIRSINYLVLFNFNFGSVAEVFNDYFANIAEVGYNIIKLSNFSEHPSVKSITERKLLDNFTLNSVNSNYIRDILDCLNPRKAVGDDGISPRIMRLSAPVLADEVTKLINYLICTRSWRTEWKCSNITPALKKAEDIYKGNYRPISILTTLSKVYEKVLYDQMYGEFCYFLSTNLSSFLKNHSCCTALLKMTKD